MLEKKLVGVIGSGNIGRNPFDPNSWSGSSRYFFSTLKKHGILKRAFGVEVQSFRRYRLLLKNFSFSREIWRHKFYLDTNYYKALTNEINKRLQPSDFLSDLIQIGGIYDVPSCVKGGCKCYSYHDGNLAQMLKSPYMPTNIPESTVKDAFDYEHRVYQGMDKIFVMSDYLRKSFIEDFGVDESKVITIGAGVNLDRIPDVGAKNYNNRSLLFIGVDFYRKGGIQLLKAFRIVKQSFTDAKLNIIGPNNLKVDSDLLNGVKFHGFLSKRNLEERKLFDAIIQSCDIFVMPSLYEPFGIAPLEAMVYKIPCILTDDWAFPEMIKPGMNGELVRCGDVDNLADKIKFLLGNLSLLEEMGEAARNMVLQNYTWDIVVKKLIDEIS